MGCERFVYLKEIEDAMAILETKGLSKYFGGLKAAENLDFKIREGLIYGLIGPNGAGKTTVFNCISRYYDLDRGQIFFHGENLTKSEPHHIPKKGIARTFQNLELFAEMSVIENLLVAQHLRFKYGILGSCLKLPLFKREERRAEEKAKDILSFLDLQVAPKTLVSNLPYGTRKLVEIGRALMLEPQLLLLDEPVSGMNSSESDDIAKLIQKIQKEFELTVFMVEHNMGVVMNICDYIYVMDHGEKLAEGAPKEIQNNPSVIEAYLGKDIDYGKPR